MSAPATYADQLLEGIAHAIELEIWEVAEGLARTLATHIRRTGEYPSGLSSKELEGLIDRHQAEHRYGPN